MYDLKKVIEANTNEGVIDFEKVMATVDNDYVNPIVAKKTDKSKLLPEAVASIIKDLGIEGESVDDLKLYVKQVSGSTDETKEELLKITKERDKYKTDYDKEVETRTMLETEAKDKAKIDMIKSLGVEDEKTIKFLKWDFENSVTDEKDFDTVVKEYAKENKVKITTPIIKDNFGYQETGEIDISDAFANLTKHKRK